MQQPPEGGYGPPPQWQPPVAPIPPPSGSGQPRRRKKWPVVVAVIAAIVVLAAIGNALGGKGSQAAGAPPEANAASSAAASTAATPTASAAPVRHTITYVVTGSPAQVQFGPTGTNRSGHVPMRITRTLRHALYYSITAQLQGGGSVRCEIKVDGKVISRASASGSYQIASCEISRDPLTGKWSDTNSG